MANNGIAHLDRPFEVPRVDPPVIIPAGPRVLIAADPANCAQLSAMLTDAGLDVVGQANDCRRAAAVSTRLRPDLVVIELPMPDSDGTAVSDITELSPVVLLAAPSRMGLLGWVTDYRAMACLVTPFVPATLVDAIELVLAQPPDRGPGRHEAADLARRLDERNLVEHAKGLLMFHQEMTEPQAHRWLQRTAMRRRVRTTRVANGVIERWGC